MIVGANYTVFSTFVEFKAAPSIQRCQGDCRQRERGYDRFIVRGVDESPDETILHQGRSFKTYR